ncbi:MAG: zinc-finger domain-containing protein [Gammaproteobacteria bacterium]|nr:zinc-finger domain-containing protein [Gammaproteobacteria bacterium]
MPDPRHGSATPNDRGTRDVSRSRLPLHCPLPEMSLWNSHPRVYLPIEKTGRAKCPYCGTDFVLKD